MSREFQVRPYQVGDENGIVDLLRQTFSDWAKRENPLDYWRWKYSDNPNGSVIYVATSGGTIVGSNHAILLNIKLGNHTFKGRYGDDAATHPDYRGLGIYSKMFNSTMQELTTKGNQLNYDVPVSPIIVKTHLKEGRKIFPHKISHMIKVKNVGDYFKTTDVANAVVKRYLFSALNKTSWIFSGLSKHPKQDDFKIVETQLYDERIDAFYDRIKNDYYFIVERNRSYLNWRYLDHRAGHYTVKLAVYGEDVLGYCVLQIKSNGGTSTGYIADLMTLSERSDVASELMRNACDYFEKRGVNAFNYRVVKGHYYQQIASAFGFIDIRSNFPLMMECGSDDIRREYTLLESSSPNHAHFTYGDYY